MGVIGVICLPVIHVINLPTKVIKMKKKGKGTKGGKPC